MGGLGEEVRIKEVESCWKSRLFTESYWVFIILELLVLPQINQHHKIYALSSEIKGYSGKRKKAIQQYICSTSGALEFMTRKWTRSKWIKCQNKEQPQTTV